MTDVRQLARDAAEALRDAAPDAEKALETLRAALFPPAEDPDPDAAFRAAVPKAAAAADDPAAATILRDALSLPLPALSDWRDAPIPDPVLWRDPEAGEGERFPDAVLSVGEVAILAGEGGSGKSTLALQWAFAAATARGDFGAAGGLRVRPGGTVIVGYEDSMARQAHRLRWIAEAEGQHFSDAVRALHSPAPLFVVPDPTRVGDPRPGLGATLGGHPAAGGIGGDRGSGYASSPERFRGGVRPGAAVPAGTGPRSGGGGSRCPGGGPFLKGGEGGGAGYRRPRPRCGCRVRCVVRLGAGRADSDPRPAGPRAAHSGMREGESRRIEVGRSSGSPENQVGALRWLRAHTADGPGGAALMEAGQGGETPAREGRETRREGRGGGRPRPG